MRALVVEDDPALRLGLKRTLLAEGWVVDVVEDGAYAMSAALTQEYDIAVLDLNLPKIDGLQVLAYWRDKKLKLGVLILTARDELSERVDGLNAGADDYLTKPFEPTELVARLRAIVRRQKGNTANQLKLGQLCFDTESRELVFSTEKISLTPREATLVELLLSSEGRVVPKNRIVSAMSSWDSNFSPNAVEIYVLKLRKKLEHTNIRIQTSRGVGYSIEESH
jgi:two-component system, OmpR family, response regulator